MPRMSPDDRREAIIDATRRTMLRKGMGATTVRDVAHEMGTSSGLIHHYFASMDELLATAFDRAVSRDLAATQATLAAADGPVERLGAFFSTYVRAEQEWAFQLWLDAWAEARRRPLVRETSRRLNVAWQQLLVAIIHDGLRLRLMSCQDPEGAAWRILSLLDGLALQAVAHRSLIARTQAIEWAVGYAEDELGLQPGAIPTDSRINNGPTRAAEHAY